MAPQYEYRIGGYGCWTQWADLSNIQDYITQLQGSDVYNHFCVEVRRKVRQWRHVTDWVDEGEGVEPSKFAWCNSVEWRDKSEDWGPSYE